MLILVFWEKFRKISIYRLQNLPREWKRSICHRYHLCFSFMPICCSHKEKFIDYKKKKKKKKKNLLTCYHHECIYMSWGTTFPTSSLVRLVISQISLINIDSRSMGTGIQAFFKRDAEVLFRMWLICAQSKYWKCCAQAHIFLWKMTILYSIHITTFHVCASKKTLIYRHHKLCQSDLHFMAQWLCLISEKKKTIWWIFVNLTGWLRRTC